MSPSSRLLLSPLASAYVGYSSRFLVDTPACFRLPRCSQAVSISIVIIAFLGIIIRKVYSFRFANAMKVIIDGYISPKLEEP